MGSVTLTPSLDEAVSLVQTHLSNALARSTIYLPVCTTHIADLLTPVSAYLKVAEHADYSFLLESVEGGEKIARYSFLGANPRCILATGEGKQYNVHGDPLVAIEHELSKIHFIPVTGLPTFTGGAVGFVSFDCVRYFEPRTNRPLNDTLGLPEAMFLYMDTIVVFDHLHHLIKVVTHIKIDRESQSTTVLSSPTLLCSHIEQLYNNAKEVLASMVDILYNDHIPLPIQNPIPSREQRAKAVSNVGESGYKNFVKRLKHHIVEGDIFQAVPSQRLARPTALHPFNAYRQLRSFNPSPYLFYLDMKDFQIVGASPEMLVQVDSRKVYTHPIAGTRKRGKTPEEDEALGRELLADPKERAEHIMLVDLGRNDCNRICEPKSVQVEPLMHLERYSHVMHIVSVVSGILRPEQNQFTAFRSIFPAGTVSGSPKVRAMELIFELEQEKRGVYAGAVGHFDYSGNMNTCIAIRTMVFKEGIAYLQAGGGIVYDSQEDEEYIETINKMTSSVVALERAEDYWYQMQQVKTSLTSTNESLVKIHQSTPVVFSDYSHLSSSELLSANDIFNLPTQSNRDNLTILIDNYDSFVFNVYQYLCMEGANVLVFRNDQTTVEHIKSLQPRNLVISPGPGKPANSGISSALILEFSGKIPVLGVCLGEQAIYEVFGGVVTYAGEIVHGKTSKVFHDGRGLYRGIPQGFHVTRYHSLAGDKATLPSNLLLTSWTSKGLVMGVRHCEYTVEGVQYHLESVMSEHGHLMIRNFLQLRGGTWSENTDLCPIHEELIDSSPHMSNVDIDAEPIHIQTDNALEDAISTPTMASLNLTNARKREQSDQAETILDRIYRQRELDVATAQQIPGQTFEQLIKLIIMGLAPPTVSLYDRLRDSQHKPAIMAEVKRASPSKGTIDMDANAAVLALQYARAGACVISVLTEPTWFKGSRTDLRVARMAVDKLGVKHRPAILCKDFLFCRYQILDARLAGADTVLLIVAILTDAKIADLMAFARVLDMEPLVEVNNADEMQRAIKAGAKVIGVNNRNLHTFDIDMSTTSKLAKMVPSDIVLTALSGITNRVDVETYLKQGVSAILVGEALMHAVDKQAFLNSLWGVKPKETVSSITKTRSTTFPLVKICGLRTLQAAQSSVNAGADMIGFIFVPGAKRYIMPSEARTIIDKLHDNIHPHTQWSSSAQVPLPESHSRWFSDSITYLYDRLQKQRFLTVGVFQNQSLQEISQVVQATGIDLVQLHGQEPLNLASLISVPVIKAYAVNNTTSPSLPRAQVSVLPGYHMFNLIDSIQGGNGQPFVWESALELVNALDADQKLPFFLAGGLTPDNVQQAVNVLQPVAVDVSSGVENRESGNKDDELIRRFVKMAKMKFNDDTK